MKTKRAWTAAVAVGFLGLLGACSSDDDDDSKNRTITWQPCVNNSVVDCGTLTVPVDYDVPDGEKIDISLRRLVALNDASDRILLLNRGGPGVSGVQIFDREGIDEFYPQAIREEFTIIGFDPRGIGESNAVSCAELGFSERDFFPLSDADVREYVEVATQLADSCFEKYGDYLLHLSTNNVVLDMEEIRKASNVTKLDFLGFSYGSRLGAVYLQKFPESSGAFVLDGVVSPDSNAVSVAAAGVTRGRQRYLEGLLGDCTGCDGQLSVERLESRVNVLLSAIETGILPAGFESMDAVGNEVGLVLSTAAGAITDTERSVFSRGPLLAYLENFDTTPLVEFAAMSEGAADGVSDGEDQGVNEDADEGADEGPEEGTDQFTPLVAVLCADDSERPTAESLIGLLAEINAESDLFAEFGMTLAASCIGWKEALSPLAPIATNTAPAALLIGGTADELTPIEMLFEMQEAIGGYAVTSDHIGHTVVFGDQSQCIDDLTIAYLVDGLAPAQSSCPFEE